MRNLKRIRPAVLMAWLTLVVVVAANEGNSMDRTIVVERVIPASVDSVWNVWTTSDGIESFFAVKADVELAIGGKFELFFAPDEPEGSRGSEDCRVLSFHPNSMLSFSWNAPPSIPALRDAGVKTWVVVTFDKIDETSTQLRINHQGIKTGEDWDQYLSYFERAWPNVADACVKRFTPPD